MFGLVQGRDQRTQYGFVGTGSMYHILFIFREYIHFYHTLLLEQIQLYLQLIDFFHNANFILQHQFQMFKFFSILPSIAANCGQMDI
jgi:hypothetical protein